MRIPGTYISCLWPRRLTAVFAFNVYFYLATPMFTPWMLLDFGGNIVILAAGLFGYLLKRAEVRALD